MKKSIIELLDFIKLWAKFMCYLIVGITVSCLMLAIPFYLFVTMLGGIT